MAPKALVYLPLFAPFTLAWGSTHDLYIRDAIPQPDPYAYEQALAARALAARKAYVAKARRAANGRVVLSRQINSRSPKAAPSAEAHEFQQYDAGLFSRDGSVIPRDPYAYATASAVAQPDPELWFEGGELYARSHSDDDDDDWQEVEQAPRKKKAGKRARKNKKAAARNGRGKNKGQKQKKKPAKTAEKEENNDTEPEKEDKEKREAKGFTSWFSSLFGW